MIARQKREQRVVSIDTRGRSFSIDNDDLFKAARELPAEELPDFIGRLESIKAVAYARLMTPALDIIKSASQEHDELLPVEVAAERLGISKDYLYRRHSQYPFSRRQGRKLLFSALGIDKYIRQQRT